MTYTIASTGGTSTIAGSGFYPYWSRSYSEPITTMEATITFTNKTSLTKEQFRAKIEKIVKKLENKYNVTDINIEL
jgi:hypothetical protein